MSKNHVIAAASVLAAATAAQADTLLSQGFEDVAGLAGAGWVQVNHSNPAGLPWGQGFLGPFAAHAGVAESYAVANFESAAFGSGGVIDNWLVTPALSFGASNTVSFWTRTIFNPSIFPDRLELRLSLAGSSSQTADFTTVLASVNPDLTPSGYPNVWTQFTATFAADPGARGRVAFRYSVPNNFNADFIGLDSVSITTAVPEPHAALLMLLGVAALAGRMGRPRQG